MAAGHVSYSDTRSKVRRHKRGFLQSETAPQPASTLLSGGMHHVATDHVGYRCAIEPSLDGHAALERLPCFGGGELLLCREFPPINLSQSYDRAARIRQQAKSTRRRDARPSPAKSSASRAASSPRRRRSRSAAALALGCGDPRKLEIGIRHVVLISLDTTRPDHFGFLGNTWIRTPRLDVLAGESIVFTDVVTAAPTTLASHTTLFTGKYPHHHGTPRNGFTVNPDNEMLTEILQRAGFHTAGFLGSFALDSRFGFDQGFDHYDEQFVQLAGRAGVDQDQRPADQVTDAVLRYLDETGVPERLFLFVHFFDPHKPYLAPEPYETAYDPRGREGLNPLLLARQAQDPRMDIGRRQALQYAAEISYMDHHIGRLLDGLRERGILDQALLNITSDHGENLLDHEPHFDHGFTVYQSTMRAVWMLRLPGGARGGTRISRIVGSVDVLPTLLGLLELPLPPGIDGEAALLQPAVEGVEQSPYFGQATKPYQQVETDPRWFNLRKARFVRDGRYKYIQTPFQGTEELYELDVDAGENVNLLRNPTPAMRALADRLRGTLDRWAESADPLPSAFDSSQSEETLKRLRSLGYVGAAK